MPERLSNIVGCTVLISESSRPYCDLDLLYQETWNSKHNPWITDHQGILKHQHNEDICTEL